jgi:hypothetical protein
MAIRTETLRPVITHTREDGASQLAALPTGTVVAVFDSRVDAVGAAVQAAVESPDGRVWIATGEQAALKIRAARAARSFFSRLAGRLSDDEAFVQHVLAEAERDKTVVVVQPHDASATLSRLAGARHVIEFGRWTTRPVR